MNKTDIQQKGQATLKCITQQLWDANKKLDHIINMIKELNEYKGLVEEEE